MKFAVFVIVSVALFGSLIEAHPRYGSMTPLPPTPHPRPIRFPHPSFPHPRPIRLRRQVLGGQLSSNPNGGADARLELSKGIGNPDHNVIRTAFAAGNTQHGPVSTGGSLAYNK